jgi:opacity protein-like surface antigen
LLDQRLNLLIGPFSGGLPLPAMTDPSSRGQIRIHERCTMLRRAAVIALFVFVSPVALFAQDTVFTVTAASADVYKSPSTGSPVIGRAARGTAHQVTRELGSWVRVEWPSSPDGVGFVHVTMGRVANGSTPREVRAVAGEAVRALPASAEARGNGEQVGGVRRPQVVTPVPHVIGVGGGLVTGSPVGYAITGRAWHRDRIGVRMDVSRHAMGSTTTARVSSLHFEPSMLVSLNDYISNFLWFRPYVGAGLTFRRQSLNTGITGVPVLSESSTGFQAYGGTELTMASAPNFSLSADFGYRPRRSAYDVFEVGGVDLTIGAHWYIK